MTTKTKPTREQVNDEFKQRELSTGKAYAFWLFLGLLGGHRYYLGRTGTGNTMLTLFLLWWILPWFVPMVGGICGIVLIIWWLIDAVLTPKMVWRHNLEVAKSLLPGKAASDEPPAAEGF